MVFVANVANSSDSYILYAAVIELVNSKIRPEQFPPSVQAGQMKEMQRSTHGLWGSGHFAEHNERWWTDFQNYFYVLQK